MNNIILILSSVLLNVTAQIFMKKGMIQVGEVQNSIKYLIGVIPNMITNIFLWLAMLCYAISIFLWMIVLSKVDVSYAYPFLSVGYIVSLFAGYFLFSENITSIRILGVIIIAIGVLLISRS